MAEPSVNLSLLCSLGDESELSSSKCLNGKCLTITPLADFVAVPLLTETSNCHYAAPTQKQQSVITAASMYSLSLLAQLGKHHGIQSQLPHLGPFHIFPEIAP